MKKYEFNFKSDEELVHFIETHDYHKNSYGADSIEEYEAAFGKVCDELCHDIAELNKAVNLFGVYGLAVDGYPDVFKVLEGRMLEFAEHNELVKKLVARKRSRCNHVLEEVGHDSHYTYYACHKCGFKDRA